jgi:hypothetical protein
MSGNKMDNVKNRVTVMFRDIISIEDKTPGVGIKPLEAYLMIAHAYEKVTIIGHVPFEDTPEKRIRQIQDVCGELGGAFCVPFGAVFVGVNPKDPNSGADEVVLVPSVVGVIAAIVARPQQDITNEVVKVATTLASDSLRRLGIQPPGSIDIIVETDSDRKN